MGEGVRRVSGLSVTQPVNPRTTIQDALRRALSALQWHADRAGTLLTEPVRYTVEIRGGVPHVTAEADMLDRQHPKCGTDTGYYYHRRRYGTTPCGPCRLAHAEAERRRKQRQRDEQDEAAA